MDYQTTGETTFLRVDKDEEVIASILEVCKQEQIQTAWVQGIGACGEVTVSTYLPDTKTFTDHTATGMIEMVSLMGNITMEKDRTPFLHCHGIFSYLDKTGHPSVLAGHMTKAMVSYTVEIMLTRQQMTIGRMPDTKTEIDIWKMR